MKQSSEKINTSKKEISLQDYTGLLQPLAAKDEDNRYTFGGWYLKDSYETTSKLEESTICQTASDHTIYAKWVGYYYKVSVWGIGEDKCGQNGEKFAGLTFGPAIVKNSSCLEHNGNHEHCIHNDSWETIISNANDGNGEWYRDCLEAGCTKEVPINLNTPL